MTSAMLRRNSTAWIIRVYTRLSRCRKILGMAFGVVSAVVLDDGYDDDDDDYDDNDDDEDDGNDD